MKSKVYFIAIKDSADISGINLRLKRLLDESGLFGFLRKGEKAAVKIHFGEEGNTGFVRPEHTRVVFEAICVKGASAFLSDTNTLYRGRRTNSSDHLRLALEHGFTRETTGMDVVIPDDTQAGEELDVPVKGKLIRSAKLARVFVDAPALVAVTHFKGHILTGFGGALKNLGMGCATRRGKLAQHCDAAPMFYPESCVGCGECAVVCPAKAISVTGKKAVLDSSKCIGCASCIAACPNAALFIDMECGEKVQHKMVEYAAAVLQGKQGKTAFLNFAVKINKECDCWGGANPRVAPDVGIFASLDPVSVDKASLDMVTEACGKDIFKEVHPDQDGVKYLEYARDMGLGSLEYELVTV
ncbi:MAG: DUF362 domain-containing protein [Candidatus Omnitrophota bacterium]